MELYSSIWHIIGALIIFLTGAIAILTIGRNFYCKNLRSLIIYFWHTFFCLTYLEYALINGADALSYFNWAQSGKIEFDFGTTGVSYLTAIFVQGLGLSLIGTFLSFNIFGTIGLLAFDACLRTATRDKNHIIQRLATLIIFLPSVSYWSSAIGKDSLSFMAVGLALWAALDLGRRSGLMAFAVAVMLLVRPHMAGMMLISVTIATLLDSRTSFSKKLVLGALGAAIAAVLVPFALRFAGVGEDLSVELLDSYVEQRQGYNMEGGGGVDIASMSLPMQLFTYMFRPLVFEAHSLFALAAAFDNLILLYLFVAGGLSLWKDRRINFGENRAFMWIYSLLAWPVLAMTTANLGIAVRQKWMFAPMLIFLLISSIGRKRNLSRPLYACTPLDPSPLDSHKLRKP